MFLLIASLLWGEEATARRIRPKFIRLGRHFEQMHLIVPKSFEGRTGKQEVKTYTIELFSHLEVLKRETATELKGRTSVLTMNSETTAFRALLWKSPAAVSDRSDCLRCHSAEPGYRRIQVWGGQENRRITPDTYRIRSSTITFSTAHVRKNFLEARYWTTPQQFWRVGFARGLINSGPLEREGGSAFIQWNWQREGKGEVSSGFHYSCVRDVPRHREWRNQIIWQPRRRLKVGLQGGIFLEGLDQFDFPFADIGTVMMASEILTPEDLPSLYSRFKHEKIPYYRISTEYSYDF